MVRKGNGGKGQPTKHGHCRVWLLVMWGWVPVSGGQDDGLTVQM